MTIETEEQRIERLQREVKQNLKDTIDQMTILWYSLGELDFSDRDEVTLTICMREEK